MKKLYKSLRTCFVVSALMATKLSAQAPSYCTTNLGGSFCGDHITNITILGTSFNNSSACNVVGNSTWQFFSPGPGTTENLIAGNTYSISVTTDANNIESLWIDYNQDGSFSASEWIQITTNSTANAATIAQFVVPITANLGLTGLRVRSRLSGNQNGANDECLNMGSGETEDYHITIISATPCSSTPPANSVITPTYIVCPNSTNNIFLATSYTVGGLIYQWQAAPNAVGPFTAIPTATAPYFTSTGLTSSTWYNLVVGCPAVSSSITTSAGGVTVAAISTSAVPYYESFESLPANNMLPNCSWQASNIPGTTQTYTTAMPQSRQPRTGSKYASFVTSYQNGTSYFYSNGIQLTAGITYSGSVWYLTDPYGYANVTDLSISVGPNQSPTGLVTIASTNGPATTAVYKELAGLFTVPTTGIYYIAVHETSNGNYGTNYLSWDDLSVTIPCQGTANSPTLGLTVSQQTVCSGDAVSITASGADTYDWNNGATGANINENPTQSTVYSVIGTNALTGCSVVAQTQMVIVNPAPTVLLFTNKPIICTGQTAILSAAGNADSYSWNTPGVGGVITVTPSSTFVYSVTGSFNGTGCSASASVQVVVNSGNQITVSSDVPGSNADKATVCSGDAVTLTGAGAVSYSYASNSNFIQAPQAIVMPHTSTTFTVMGASANGCVTVKTYELEVKECVGINEIAKTLTGVSVYPNPTSGVFTVELNDATLKTVQVTDLTGRVIMTTSSNNEKINVNVNNLAAGIYYVKVQSNDAVDVIKVVKH